MIRARAFSSVEYLVGCAVVLAIVAVPVDGRASALAFLLDALRSAAVRFVVAVAWPA